MAPSLVLNPLYVAGEICLATGLFTLIVSQFKVGGQRGVSGTRAARLVGVDIRSEFVTVTTRSPIQLMIRLNAREIDCKVESVIPSLVLVSILDEATTVIALFHYDVKPKQSVVLTLRIMVVRGGNSVKISRKTI